jgi:hypothetical protein
MRRQYIWSVVIGLLLVVSTSQGQGPVRPLHFNNIPLSLVRTPGTLIVDHTRVPLAVPSFVCATTTEDWVADILPRSELMYQDRHWGYWLGFSSWNGYSLLTGQSPWGRHWGTVGHWPGALSGTPLRVTSINSAASVPTPPTQVPEPHSMILFGLGSVWIAARSRRRLKTV